MSIEKATDLCKIIASCSECGVKSFEFGEIKIEFHEKKDDITHDIIHPQQPVYYPTNQTEPLEVDPEFEKTEEKLQYDDDFETLSIEDPGKYERLLAEGRLDEGEADAESY